MQIYILMDSNYKGNKIIVMYSDSTCEILHSPLSPSTPPVAQPLATLTCIPLRPEY